MSGEVKSGESPARVVAFMAPGQNIKDEAWEDGLRLLEEPGTEAIYDTVKKASGVDVIEICERDEPVIDPSEIQPAAFGIGYAHSEALKAREIRPDFVICFSASEILMSAVSGSITVAEGAATARQRGELQQRIAGGTGGGVVALHRRPLALRPVKSRLKDMAGVHFAGKITPLQSTYSYRHGARDSLVAALNSHPGIRRVVDVPNLDFPMHAPDLKEVREGLASFMEAKGIVFKDAVVPHIATRTARLNRKARTIKRNLIWQTDHPINLEDGVRLALRLGVNDFYDLGPGNTMANLMRHFPLSDDVRIDPVKLWEDKNDERKT